MKLQKSVVWLLKFKDLLRSRAKMRKECQLIITQFNDDKEQASAEKSVKDSVRDMSQVKRFLEEELISLAIGQPVKH